jgi:hypothetical protein
MKYQGQRSRADLPLARHRNNRDASVRSERQQEEVKRRKSISSDDEAHKPQHQQLMPECRQDSSPFNLVSMPNSVLELICNKLDAKHVVTLSSVS